MTQLLSSSPLYHPPITYRTKSSTTKGQDIMMGLLLDQYQNSPNFQEYLKAFIIEMDYLFEQIEAVYFGRFIMEAEGAQLDVIGIILQQPRAVALPTQWFGFQGAVDVAGMADSATPANGGIFRDGNLGEPEVVPLDDITYRRLLLAKATVTNRDTADLSLAYYIVTLLLGRVPSVFNLVSAESGDNVEVITNGTFDTDISGWYATAGATPSWDNGRLSSIPAVNGEYHIVQQMPTQIGQDYSISVDFWNISSPHCALKVGTSDGDATLFASPDRTEASGTIVGNFRATDTTTWISLESAGTAGVSVANFDNVTANKSNNLGIRQVELVLSGKDVSSREEALINYASRYFVPAGISFETTRI